MEYFFRGTQQRLIKDAFFSSSKSNMEPVCVCVHSLWQMQRSTQPPQQCIRPGRETRWRGQTQGQTVGSGWIRVPSGAAVTPRTFLMSPIRVARGGRRPPCRTQAPGGEAWALRSGWRRPGQKAPVAQAPQAPLVSRPTVQVKQAIIKVPGLFPFSNPYFSSGTSVEQHHMINYPNS